MKKIISLCVIFVLSLSIVACGNEKEESKEITVENTEKYKIGDTVSTEIYEFTLKRADLTIACSNSNDETYLLPKEYDASDDSNNPFVAPMGTTIISLEFDIKNLDRAKHGIGYSSGDLPLNWEVTYNGENYSLYRKYDAQASYNPGFDLDANYTIWDGVLEKEVTGRLIEPGQSTNIVTYAVVPVNITDMDSPFEITVFLKDVSGEKVYFTYSIN